MNILILTNHLNIGGITRYVLNLSYGLKKRGHSVFIGSSSGWAERFLKDNNIGLIRLPLKTKSIFSPYIIFCYFILKRFIKQENIELIHAQTRITQFLACQLSERLRIASVSTFHGFYRPHLLRKMVPCLGNLTIANSQAVGQHLIQDFNLKQEKLRVIYNSVGPALSNSINKDHSFVRGDPTLGVIARLSKEKGHLILFVAFKKLIQDYPKAKLLVVGKGKQEQLLKDWVRQESLDRQILFLGELPDLSSLFKILDVCLLPSIIEGLGLSILEAQAAGVPVVASSIGGITEIIKDKETGILVRPGDSDDLYRGIKILLSDPLLQQRIVNNAKREVLQRFSLDNMVDRVESVYKELMHSVLIR